METVSVWVGIAGPIAGLIGAYLVHLGAKRDSRRTGETDFRDDLMETIDRRDARILILEQRIQDEQTKNQELRDRNVELAADNAALRAKQQP